MSGTPHPSIGDAVGSALAHNAAQAAALHAARAAELLPATAVPCTTCAAEADAPCTSHSGTRTRRDSVHQARTAAWARQQGDKQ